MGGVGLTTGLSTVADLGTMTAVAGKGLKPGSKADEYKDYSAATLFSPIGAARELKRNAMIDDYHSKGKYSTSHPLAEGLGIYTNMAPSLLGALAGPVGYGITGSATGLAKLIGLLVGMGKGRRSGKEHADYLDSKGSLLSNYLVPGAAEYNRARRYISRYRDSI